MSSTRLKKVLPDSARPDMWVQEEIFGHRFIEEQKPFMIVLETLSIVRMFQVNHVGTKHPEIRIFRHSSTAQGEHERIQVPFIQARELRYILFKDSSLAQVAQSSSIVERERMAEWVKKLNEGYKATVKGDERRFDYLTERYPDRFDEVRQAVRILRGLELDAFHNRRWTSRFINPRGPNLHLSDVDEKFTRDRRFFGRGGELVYLMLSRSSLANDLGELITDRFFPQSDPFDTIAKRLSPSTESGHAQLGAGTQIGHLPHSSHPAFDRMATDWKAIFSLDDLPAHQQLEPLFRITSLNLVRYFADQSREVMGQADSDPMPLDVTFGATSDLRSLSKAFLVRLRKMISDAAESFIRDSLKDSHGWRSALEMEAVAIEKEHSDQPEADRLRREAASLARETIGKQFDFEKAQSLDASSPSAILDTFIETAKTRSRNNISTLIQPLGTAAGFVESRKRLGSWFCASDPMLEALVLARVRRPITISEFLSDLYETYGIVIAPAEASRAFRNPACDISSFEENLHSLERRLTSLGYVKRLSDDCAFVSNRYCPNPD